MSRKFKNQNIAGIWSHKLLVGRKKIHLKNTCKSCKTKILQVIIVTPKKNPKCEQSGRCKVQNRAVVTLKSNIFIFLEKKENNTVSK